MRAAGVHVVTRLHPQAAYRVVRERALTGERTPEGDVVRLYRKRWQIELFFRWLKHVLGAIRPFGHSRAAVQLTLIVASIVAVLAQLLEPLRPSGVSRVCWLRVLAVTLLSALRLSG